MNTLSILFFKNFNSNTIIKHSYVREQANESPDGHHCLKLSSTLQRNPFKPVII